MYNSFKNDDDSHLVLIIKVPKNVKAKTIFSIS